MRNIVLIITLIMSVMLFADNPIDSSSRLYQGLWNTGHLFFFAFLTWLLITQTYLSERSWLKMLVVSLVFSLLLGGLIEIVQFLVGRYMEWQDLFTDMLGALFGFLVVQFSVPVERRFTVRPVIILLSIIVLSMTFYPVFSIVRDNQKMQADFPVIADFESEDTLVRWDNEDVSKFEIDYQLYTKGESSVLVEFTTGDYPGVSLEVVYPDWSGYNFFDVSVHNDQNENLDIEIKVYDHLHKRTGYNYGDRFNHVVNLHPGWNTLKIKLLDVFHAPKGRSMNLDDIAGFSLFIHDPDEIKTIHLDDIHLSN